MIFVLSTCQKCSIVVKSDQIQMWFAALLYTSFILTKLRNETYDSTFEMHEECQRLFVRNRTTIDILVQCSDIITLAIFLLTFTEERTAIAE